METKKYVRRTEEGRNKFANIFSIGLIIAILSMVGMDRMIEGVESQVKCTGSIACLTVEFGSMAIVFVGILALYFILELFFYLLSKWKEVDPKESRRKK